ncbi:MAG: 16S rRNA (uracil(1498)-N(3))-methyltransferase [Phycisphaerae bacterium]|nr:16S rRNA (uracil(1498)-N(3))-methyltransferase [Phycisphaerae bacterium]
MDRFFVEPAELRGDRVSLGKAHAHQICRVLRLRPGDRIVVLDNTGSEFEVSLTAVDPAKAEGRILATRSAQGEPRVDLTLYQGLLARDKFEQVLQKGTEVGVRRFVPVITERSIVRDAHAFTEGRMLRWHRILTEAAEQSGRGLVPELRPPIRFEQGWAGQGVGAQLIGCPGPASPSLHEVLADAPGPRAVGLWIGPEGGFSDGEVALARSAGCRPFSLGRRILRTETAAMIASALVLYELRQLED